MVDHGSVIVLNGPPRSGKSSIAAAIQEQFPGMWLNLGADVFIRAVTPPRWQPGIGLRPGGERPDLEAWLPRLYTAMYESVAAHSRAGLHVVVDVAHHDAYSTPLRILPAVATHLSELPAWLVGVHCPLEVIMQRRHAGQSGREGAYALGESGEIPEPVRRWQAETHRPGIYDLEVDTAAHTATENAAAIWSSLHSGKRPTAFRRLAEN